jgi:tripartite-type tricarboxylate transporter receptor subunit TctC
MRAISSYVFSFSTGLMLAGTGLVSGLFPSNGWAQPYPNKPIRVLTGEAGSSNDVLSRLIGPSISVPLGQAVITDNRGPIGYDIVAKASPDGYTLMVAGATFWLGPLLKQLTYDPQKHFSPITLAIRQPNMIVIPASLPVKSVRELIALAKARPGELNYASGQAGASNHLAAELFKSMAGVNIVRIGYKSGGAAANAVISGEVHVLFISTGSGAPFVKSGKLRALAVASAEPTVLAPGLPTVSASGLPGFESTAMAGVFAPAKTPTAIITRLNQEIVRFLNQAEAKDKLFNLGQEVVAGTPAQLAATVKAEMTRLGKVIKDVGIKGE